MKLLKKFGIVILAVIVFAAGVCVPNIFKTDAYAEGSGTVTKLIEGITFEDLDLGTKYAKGNVIYAEGKVAGCKKTYVKIPNSSNTNVYEAEVAGDASDKFLKIGSNNISTEIQVAEFDSHKLAGNDTYVLSFKYLAAANSNLNLYMRFGDNTNALLHLCSLSTATLAKISNANTSYSLGEKDIWHNIKVVITAGTRNTADTSLNTNDTLKFYSDGKLLTETDWVISGKTAPYTADTLQRIDFTGKSASIDDIKFTSYKDGAVYTPATPELITANGRNTGYANGNIYAGNKTAGEVIADTNIAADTENVASYEIVDENGEAVADTETAAGNTLNITTVEGTVISVPILGNVGKAVTVPVSGSSITNLAVTEEDGIYGKTADDKVWKLSPTDLDTIASSKIPEVRLTSVSDPVPSVIRMSVMGKISGNFGICGRIIYTNDSNAEAVSGGHNLVRFANGAVLINDATGSSTSPKKQIGIYKDDEWLSVEIALFPGESEYLVRINGGNWNSGYLGVNGKLWETFVKNGYVQIQISKTAPCDVYIDDFDFYSGIPSDTLSAPEVTALGGSLTKTGRAIYGPYNRDIGLYIDKISVSEGAQKRFINSDGSLADSDGIYNGRKMVLANNGILTYYDLYSRSNAFTSIENTETGVKYWADIANGNSSDVPVVFNAVYENDNGLQGLKSIEQLDYAWKEKGVTLEFTVPNTDEQNRKIMIWNKDTLVPMTQSFGMLPSTIYLVSDSICKTYTNNQRPLAGWGEYIGYCFADAGIAVSNRAEGGRSTKSFRAEGRWDGICGNTPGIMATLKANDYVFISMGHNDGNVNSEAAYTTIDEYKANLAQYIDEARAVGARVILITPPTDAWSGRNSLLERSTAMKEVAAAKDVTLLDLNERSWEHFNEIGFENATNKYFCTAEKFSALGKTPTNEKGDLTHFDETGAKYLAKTIAALLKESSDLLANAVNPNAITAE